MSGGLYLIARIAGRAVAFPADRIDSAVDLGDITPVPRAGPGVVGLAALRSRVVTVVDPRVILKAVVAADPSRRAVVARVEGHTYAFLVDELDDVAEFAVQPLPPGLALAGGWATAAAGLIDRDGEPALVIAIEALVPSAGMPALAA